MGAQLIKAINNEKCSKKTFETLKFQFMIATGECERRAEYTRKQKTRTIIEKVKNAIQSWPLKRSVNLSFKRCKSEASCERAVWVSLFYGFEQISGLGVWLWTHSYDASANLIIVSKLIARLLCATRWSLWFWTSPLLVRIITSSCDEWAMPTCAVDASSSPHYRKNEMKLASTVLDTDIFSRIVAVTNKEMIFRWTAPNRCAWVAQSRVRS